VAVKVCFGRKTADGQNNPPLFSQIKLVAERFISARMPSLVDSNKVVMRTNNLEQIGTKLEAGQI